MENIVRASYLNVTKNLVNSMGPQLLLQASVYARIGVSHLSWLSSEVFRECYAGRAPFEDFLKNTFRNSQVVCHLSPHIASVLTKRSWLNRGDIVKLRTV